MTFRLLAPAIDDLDRIDEWITENFGDAAALRARRKLLEVFAILADFPEMGMERPDVTPHPVRFFCHAPNWIVYEPGQPLLVHRIYPAPLDLKALKLS